MNAGMSPSIQRVALIGYGEVGQILAEDLRAQGKDVSAYDLKLESAASAEPLRDHASRFGVELAADHQTAVADADLIVCAVTASETVAAAQACAAGIGTDGYFLDFNSASPKAKQQAADCVNGRYVEGAVMTSVPPHRIGVPILLGGEYAASLSPLLNELGFQSQVASQELGVASATKMCRSVMIKGMEALVIESLTTARSYGVEGAVVASLYETFPGIDWEQQAAYFFHRVIQHGRRRSEEMFEVAATVSDTGLTPLLSQGIAQRQAAMADLREQGAFGQAGDEGFGQSPDWRTEADRLLKANTERG